MTFLKLRLEQLERQIKTYSKDRYADDDHAINMVKLKTFEANKIKRVLGMPYDENVLRGQY